MKHIFALTIFFFSWSLFAQRSPRYTISGFVTDSQSAESLINATVYNKTNSAGAITNQYGFYSLTLPEGDVELVFSYVGYKMQTAGFRLRGDTVININLMGGLNLQEIVITSDRTSCIQENTQMSMISVPIVQIKSFPGIMGETDVMRVLKLMPGIQSGSERSAGLHVRGGSSDQNLFLLDGVPIYNISHPLDYVSLFNGDAINNIDTYKGGFPARYGGRVSSVIDISMKEGNMQKFHGEVCAGTAWKLTVEGPIVKNRTSFILTGRRTFYDLLMSRLANNVNKTGESVYLGAIDTRFSPAQGTIDKIGYYFYDLTAKINHKFSDKDRVYLSAYLGDDKMNISVSSKNNFEENGVPVSGNNRIQSGLQWGNFMTTFRWNHIFTNRLFSNATLSYSRYRDNFINEKDIKLTYPQKNAVNDFYKMQNISGIKDWIGKISFDYLPSPDHYVRFGAGVIYHVYNPGTISMLDTTGNISYGADKRYAYEYNTYVEDDIRLTKRLKTNAGLHWSAFSIGDKFYSILQPRIAARYLITSQMSAKVSYAHMAQFIHLLSVIFNNIPRDFWVPATELLRPQQSNQIAFGFAQEYRYDLEISLEGYYKTMTDVLDYKEGAGLLSMDKAWEQKLLHGTGTSYGFELLAQKKTGAFSGWAGYMLSWTDRHFDELNDGRRFPYKYDRRHDINAALMQHFGKKKNHEISAAWTYGSGYCVTLPIGVADVSQPIRHGSPYFANQYYIYSERNGYRMNSSHRLDISIAIVKQTKQVEHRWVLGIYNAYNRKNPYVVTVQRDNDGTYRFVQYSMFTIMPSITYHFKF